MNVLDQGYVNLIGSWGSDEQIIEAARMSTQKGFKRLGYDRKSRRREVATLSLDTQARNAVRDGRNDY